MNMLCKVGALLCLCTMFYMLQVKGVWIKGSSPIYTGVSIKGDPGAIGRSLFDSLNPWAKWRAQWKWIVLHVDSQNSHFLVNYQSGEQHKEFSRALKTPYVAVRIGTGDVIFWVTKSVGGAELEVPVEAVSGLLSKADLKNWCKEQKINCDEEVTWI